MLIISRVVALRAAPVFSDLPEHVLAKVAAVVSEVPVEAGQTIITEGMNESWMFVLVSGSATVELDGTAVANLGPGALIGELSALDAGPRAATVTATEPGLLFRLDHAALLDVMVDQPELATAMITMLVRRLRHTNAAVAAA